MAELRYTYLLDVKDMASRLVAQANAKIASSVERANLAMRQQGTVAESASRKVQTAGARQAAEWKQVERAARTAERSVAQAATQASASVSRAMERQVAAQRKAGLSYAQIARQQKAAGVSARETAAAIEQSAAREQKAMAGSSRAAKGLGGVASGFKGFAGIALAAGGVSVLTTALRDSVKEGTEAVKAHAQTVAALKSTGGAAGVTAKQIETLSTSISNQVGIDDEAIQSAENLLLTFTRVRNETGKGNDVFNRATKTIVDMSVAMKVPLKNASVLVGKALQDPIRGLTSLRRVGVSFTDQQRAQIAALVKSGRSMQAQKLILRELNREFGGSAKAAATPMQKLGVVVKNLEEAVGLALLPVINKAAAALARFFTQMQTGRGAGGQFAATVTQVWKATKGVAVALGPAAKALAAAFGPAARVARTAIGGMLQTIRGIVGVVKGVVSVAAHLIRGDFAGAWRAVKGVVRSALSGLGGLVKTLMAPVYTAVSGTVRRAIGAVGRLGSGIVGVLRGAVGGVAKAAGAVAGAVLSTFRTLSRLIGGVWDGIVRTVKGAISTIKGAVDSVTSLPGKIFGRSGGIAHPGGFRRYQHGGLVPAMLSPGEMVVHGNAGMMIPGRPVAADNVPMLLPVGSAVLTGDGQRRMMAGASVAQAVAQQAPHFRTGGHVRGRVSWFGGPHDSQDSGHTALGLTTATPGVAIRPGDTWQTGKPTLGQYWRVRLRNGRTAVLRQTDLGPNQSTGRRIDITYSALRKFGYSEGNFPTDSIGVADLVGRTPGSARAAVSGRTPDRVSYTPRGRLITSGRAMQLGFEAGLEGGSLYGVYSSVRDAATYNRTVTPGRTVSAAGGGRGGAGAGRRPKSGGGKSAWRGVGPQGVHSAVRGIAAAIMGAFPALQATSTTGGGHASGSYHYRGRAVDIAGPQGAMDRAAVWTRNRYTRQLREGIHQPGLSVKNGQRVSPGFWGPSTWAGHRNHLHVAARRGGWIGFQLGGRLTGGGSAVAPSQRPFVPAGVPVDRLAGRDQHLQLYLESVRRLKAAQAALLKAGAHDNAAVAKALHDVDRGLQDVGHISYARLQKMARNLTATIKGTKDPDTSRKLKAELRLVFGEMGRRIGLLAKQAADMVDPAVRAATQVERVLKVSKGKILSSAPQLAALERASTVSQQALRGAIGLLQKAYQRAAKANLKGAMKDLAGRIGDLMGQLSQTIRDAASAAVDAADAVTQRKHAAADRAQREVTAGMMIAGVDPSSPEGLLTQYRGAGRGVEGLQADRATLERMLPWARGSGNQDAVKQIIDALAENGTEIKEGLGNMADLARQGQDAVRQRAIDSAGAGVSLAQTGLQKLGLEQQLAGTYEGGGQARADYITQKIIPAIQAQIDAMQRNGASTQDIMNAQNDLLQAQLDAQDAIKQNTEDTADALKNLGGTLGFEFQGSRLTDDLLASGVGA